MREFFCETEIPESEITEMIDAGLCAYWRTDANEKCWFRTIGASEPAEPAKPAKSSDNKMIYGVSEPPRVGGFFDKLKSILWARDERN